MKKYLYIIALFFIFISCKKTINVDLNDAPSQIVIEGIVNDVNTATVIISRSVTVSSNNVYPAVSNATVSIKDNLGNTSILTESATKGTYKSSLTGVSGRTYMLTVIADGKTYTATSTMPALVNLDSLRPDLITFGNKNLKVVVPVYTDPPGLGNCYQFVEMVNSRYIKNINVLIDIVNDGGTNTRRIIYSDPDNDSLNIKTGDTVSVEMRCIDKYIYRYMSALADLQGNQTTPTNPESNISNGALGYFSAHTSRTKKIIMP
jgi:hypothetical protein